MPRLANVSLLIFSQKAKEAGLLLATRLLVAVVGPLVNLWLVRYMQVDLYGSFAIANGITSLVMPLAWLGLPLTVVRYASRHPDQVGTVRNYALLIGIIYSIVAYGLVSAVVFIKDYSILIRQLTFILAIEGVFSSVSLVLMAQAQVFARYRVIALVNLSSAAMRWILTIGLLLVRADVRLLFGISILFSGLLSVCGLWDTKSSALSDRVIPTISGTAPSLLDIFKSSLTFGFGDLVYLAYFRSGVVILSWFCAVKEVGFYNLPFMILNLVYLVPTVLVEILNPRLFRLSKESLSQFEHHVTLISKLMLVFGLAFAVGLFMSADFLITLLYGKEFVPASPYLKILAWAIPLRCWCQVVAAALAAADEMPAKNRRQPVAAVFNVLANLLLVPTFGARAAAWVAVGTEVVLLSLYVPLLYRRVFPGGRLSQLQLPVLGIVPLTVLVGWMARLSASWLSVLILGSSIIVGGLLARTRFFCVREWVAVVGAGA